MLIGRVLCIPWGSNPPQIADFGRKCILQTIFIYTFSFMHIILSNVYNCVIKIFVLKYFVAYNNITVDANGTEILGCPITQEWCLYTPQLTITQFFIGYGFTSIGYPLGVTLIQTIFSKILGPRPQGVWMGLMTGAGCASRVLGPVFIGLIYTRLGTYHTFGITGAMLLISMLWLQFVSKRLISPEMKKKDEAPNRQGKDVEIPLVHLRSDNTQTSRETVKFNGISDCDCDKV